MSVYGFGKVVGASLPLLEHEIEQLALRSCIEISLGLGDSEDDKVLQESPYLRGEGIAFNIFTPGDSDIGALWEEAFLAGRKALQRLPGDAALPQRWADIKDRSLPPEVYAAMIQTRLGQFLEGLTKLPGARSMGIAMFDNGVDQLI